MADGFYVKPAALAEAAEMLRKQTEAFREAAKEADRAAEALCGMWEGDARDTFYQEQKIRTVLYEKMAGSMESLSLMLKTAGNRYTGTDIVCAGRLRRK